jgi:hypothetical protein
LAARGCPSMAERVGGRTGQRQNSQRQTTIAYLISSRDLTFASVLFYLAFASVKLNYHALNKRKWRHIDRMGLICPFSISGFICEKKRCV